MVPQYMTSSRCYLHTAAFLVFAAALIILPVMMGGNRPAPLMICQILMGISFALLAYASPEVFYGWPRRLAAALVLFGVVLSWSLLQMAGFTPEAWHDKAWLSVSQTLHMPYHGSVSLSPYETCMALLRLSTYGMMLTGVFILTRNNDYALTLLRGFWYAGVALCLYGIVTHLTGISPFLWIEKTEYKGDLTSTFVNRNHFADYAGLVLMTGIALACKSVKSKKSEMRLSNNAFRWTAWFNDKGFLYAIAFIVILISLMMTHSRAGIVSTFLGVAVFISAYLIYQRNFRMAFALPVLLLSASVCLLIMVLEYTQRFAILFTDYSSLMRFRVYEIVAGLIRDNPLLGYGLGSFDKKFHMYRDETFIVFFNRVHSDWLETIFDLGVPVALILFACLALVVSGCCHGIRFRRRNGLYPALGLGASALMLSHALFDFNMQIPGLMASWFILLGSGLAHSWSPRQKVAD